MHHSTKTIIHLMKRTLLACIAICMAAGTMAQRPGGGGAPTGGNTGTTTGIYRNTGCKNSIIQYPFQS
jgi:hypothetical protein